jgi:hypothetical protein
MGMRFKRVYTMSSVESTAEQEPMMTETKRKIAPRRALGNLKKTSRQPGRPHKRLEKEVLSARTSVLHKKLQVLLAKRTLITERLEAYENETTLRQNEQGKEKEEE